MIFSINLCFKSSNPVNVCTASNFMIDCKTAGGVEVLMKEMYWFLKRERKTYRLIFLSSSDVGEKTIDSRCFKWSLMSKTRSSRLKDFC